MTDLIWCHEDSLRINHPVFKAADGDCRAIFIWDDSHWRTMGFGFKKLHFIYETAANMGIDILKGDSVETLQAVMVEVGADRLLVADTPNPYLQGYISAISKKINVKVIADETFVTLDRLPKAKRFFRYWNKVKKQAMQLDGDCSQ